MRYLIVLFLFTVLSLHAQKRETADFGVLSASDRALTSYSKDPEASGVVLFEQGNYYFELINNRYVTLVKEVHRKIKVLDAANFDESEIEIELLKNDKTKEKLVRIEALTHNELIKDYVKSKDIFTLESSDYITNVRFAFPNVKNGSILEYRYRIESPFFGNLNGWYFQNSFPTLYSEFTTKIPGNFNYNRSLRGSFPLFIDEATKEKFCFHIEGYSTADCELAVYAMKNLPAFERESFMLSPANYLSGVSYELRDYLDYSGSKKFYSKEWDDVDTELKTDKDIGRQLKSKRFFRNQLPEGVVEMQDPLEKAKAIYSFIQDHYRWNGKQRLFTEVRVEDAFKEGTANTSEINLSLINALQSADLDAHLVLSTTRDRVVPVSIYPVLDDFNYSLVQLTIANEVYFLDATNKLIPFGIIPFNTLNLKGRVMDFKKGSYWTDILPHSKNILYVNTQIHAAKDGLFTGKVRELRTGYVALSEREKMEALSLGAYTSKRDGERSNLQLNNLVIENQKNIDDALEVLYNITLETENAGNKIFINPYFYKTYFDENPFNDPSRQWPVEMGHPLTLTYLMNIDLGSEYKVDRLPENRNLSLDNNDGSIKVLYSLQNTNVSIRLDFKLNQYQYNASGANALGQLFNEMIEAQNKDLIVLTKNE